MAAAAPDEVEYGEVFTRRWVVETILDLVGYTANKDLTQMKLVEPSVGSGAFFVPVLERLLESAKVHGTELSALAGCLYGLDLQQEHVATCRKKSADMLQAAGARPAEARALSAGWLRHGDFLLDEVPTDVDFVIGNPPYIRTEDLDDETEAAYRKTWRTMRGRADIYVGFYERSLSMLASGGRVGFICADRWMRNAYGKHLRGLVTSRYAVESVWQMHDVDPFEAEVSAYPAITVLANSEQGSATFIVRADVQQGVAGGGPHAPAEVGQGVADPPGEHIVIAGQVARGDPVHRVRRVKMGGFAGVVRVQGRLRGLRGG
ncbi:Eco57I restriction-modification methylase domain-containing protein [Streptomyces collinus]|uniref:Eco57I restriction-modification methylase domain-containing protein n=1 Tax=Streptomyces collinus TaxID=42684 RepID=UPI003792FE22